MEAEKQLSKIKETFQLAQQPHQNHAKLMAALSQTYNTVDRAVFHEEFIRHLKYAMIIYKREPAVERVIDFVASFANSFHKSEKEDDDDDGDENSFVNYLFSFLLESHEVNSYAVRFRVCQLINKILGNMPENALIDDDLFDKINQAMLVRLKDKTPNVRIQAVLALSRLQDPKDSDCPVVNAFITLLENDSNPEVRRAVLSCIALSAKTLSKIIERTRDVKEAVRKLAYQILAEKVHMRVLSIAQRVKLLQQGFSDRSDAVKEVMQKKVLQAWLSFTDGDILELLHRLDVENCPEVAVLVLTALFSSLSLSELVQNFKDIAGSKMIPVETLNPENSVYWRTLCEYLKSKGDEGEDFLEQILPEPAVYAEYLFSYFQSMPVITEEQRGDFACIENLMTKEFIGQQLILMIGCLDTSEEGGRKRLLAVLQELLVLPKISTSLMSSLVEKLLRILKDDNKKTQIVAEIISEIREPIVAIEVPIDPVEKGKKQLMLAEVKVKLMEAKDALEEYIALQHFNQASVLKERITSLEKAKKDLIKEVETPEIKETCVEKSDPETLLKCLTVCYELLKQLPLLKRLCPTMIGIIESLILPGITNVYPSVRNMAVLCLGCCGLQNQEFSSQHLALLLQVLQIDDFTIKVSALKATFDQLMLFGIEPFKAIKAKRPETGDSERNGNPEEEETKMKEVEEETATVKNLLKLLSSFLDSEVSELRTEAAEGLAKLLFSGRLVSTKILSRLILLWYNPLTEDDVKLRHCLGVFFPLFAYASRTNQEYFEEAFLPTLQTLVNAPASSPLSEVDVANVSELLVDLTRSSGLDPRAPNSQDTTVHDSLAIKICNEILTYPSAPEVRIYVKALDSLELSGSATEDLLVLLDKILGQIKDRTCLRVLEKIKLQLSKGGVRPAKAQDLDTTTARFAPDKEEKIEEAERTLLENEDDKELGRTVKPRSTQNTTARGRRKGTTESRRTRGTVKLDSESDPEIPEATPEVRKRLPRRAKTAALAKTQMNLALMLSEESD
ncbi:condensin complex subunit 3 [Ornithorhynchus anatinus]|uniref:Non-SMC condensin I complex subunit G n=1 Tax=Ornithorhynchus anatinus TaxID=9258 RepID=F6X9I8_ORNAN|nr:condensin complex subunit 3 [Ornithorhynchus anatinus]